MESKFKEVGNIELPYINGEYQMIPFNLETLEGLTGDFKRIAKQMLLNVKAVGTGYLTVHGKLVRSGKTLRRPAPHTDGNYEPVCMSFGTGGGNGWKVGENGPSIDTNQHKRQYLSEKGGLILATNYASCLGWKGTYSGLPNVGGDCRHIKLNEPELLKENQIYYGNNHFIHESIPVGHDVHRVFARITLPETHVYA